MALDNFTALKEALSSWLDGSDLAGREDDFIALAEAEMNALLAKGIEAGRDVRPMTDRSTLMISAEYIVLPDDDTVQPISIEITSLDRPWQVDFIDQKNMVDQRFRQDRARREIRDIMSGDPPAYFSIVGSELRFYPAPQTSFTAEFIRYVRIPALSDSNQTNWLLTAHPNAYLYGALAQAELFGWNDGRLPGLTALFTNAMDGVLARYPKQVNQLPARTEIPLPTVPWGFIR